ncbi:hypothetical protein OG883_45200 [Streptomyces sp. NBC_01142]|uniref:hypothetical protein n=1 Tax=Streptomyces sp. NBC_01142 TaxID=2975865 RepID=UPI0022501F70|nr:hypothetical protein [Streptomyces sp. NBC_01142]MCX4826837.1 hypothetical protein [Streptomyces sp. NBC_01142]
MIEMSGSSAHTDQLLSTLEAAAEKFTQAGDRGKEAAVRFDLGRYLFQLDRGGAAFEQLRRAAEILEQEGLTAPAAQALLGCGHALTTEGRHEDSLPWFDRAIGQFARCQDKAGELEASAAKLEALADLNRWSHTNLSNEIIAATDHKDSLRLLTFRLVAFRYQTQARLAAGDPVGSVGPARQAADAASRLGDPHTEATFRLALAHNLRILKEMALAAEEYEQVLAVVRDLPGADDLEREALKGLEATLDD